MPGPLKCLMTRFPHRGSYRSQEKDEGVSWNTQKKCCWVWGNWLVLSLWWFNVCVSLLMCFAVWSGKVLFTSGLVEHLCSLSIKSLSTQRFYAWAWLHSYAAMPKLWEAGKTNDLLVSWFGLAKVPVQSKSKKWLPTPESMRYPKSFGVDVHCILNGDHYQNIARSPASTTNLSTSRYGIPAVS